MLKPLKRAVSDYEDARAHLMVALAALRKAGRSMPGEPPWPLKARLKVALHKAEGALAIINEGFITCPRCGLTSYNKNDISERYCGNCCKFHDQF